MCLNFKIRNKSYTFAPLKDFMLIKCFFDNTTNPNY